MNSSEILKEFRVRLGDVDGILDFTSVDYSDDYLTEYLKSSNILLATTGILSTTYTFTGNAVSPEPTTVNGLLIAAHAVWTFLKSDLAKKVRDGELGVKFKSGQDEISTVEAARRIDSAGDDAYKEYRILVMAKLGAASAGSARLQ